MPVTFIYLIAGMLFVGVLPLSDGYYEMLRLVSCASFGFVAFVSYDRQEKNLPWIYGFLALIFNPIIEFQFTKEMWDVVHIVAGILLLANKEKIKTPNESQ
tara:strand:+ start:17091 stop:17393 length:303 start_codon:yes stop_codon:yes gene_type:complete